MSDHITLIENLSENIPEKSITINTDTDKNSLLEIIIDLSEQLETRIQYLELFYEKFGQEETLEIVSRLSTMYQFSGTKILEKYLYEICMNCKISSFLKITIAKSLCYFDQKGEIGYKALDYVCQHMADVATPCQIDAICLLMTNKKYKQQSRDYFCIIINDEKLECDYRYKTILSLEKKEIPNYIYFLAEASLEFFNKRKNRTLYRILAGQVLMQKCNLSQSQINNIQITLLSFSQDPDLDYNLRADAADVILRLGSDENKLTARKIIMMLGRQDGQVKTIFDNAQNVHLDEIEDSVLNALEFLSSIEMKTISGVPGSPTINFEYVKKHIDNLLKKEKPTKKDSKEMKEKYKEKVDKINISLNRIYLDRALYSNYNCTLLHILLKIWTYLSSHKSKKEMKKRLLEELMDMSGTCSSGFAGRLVNVISGFGDFNLRISWRDQIIANFTGRLNAKARDISSEEKRVENAKLYKIKIKEEKNTIISIEEQLDIFQENVLEEMTIDSGNFSSRPNFLKFFRKNMLGIRQELAEEFKNHIPDNDFDLYFRAAISTYETGGYV